MQLVPATSRIVCVDLNASISEKKISYVPEL